MDREQQIEHARQYLVENFQGHVHGNEWGVTRSFSISGAGNERTPNTTMRTPEGWHHLPYRILAASPHLQGISGHEEILDKLLESMPLLEALEILERELG